MPPAPTATVANPNIDLDDEPYDSAEDEDFTLDPTANDDDVELSSSDEEADTAEPAAKRRKTKKDTKDSAAPETEALDSGDEATIRKVKEKKHMRGGNKSSDDEDDVDFDEDEDVGQGGFVRTRAMKMRIQEERRPLAKIDGATIDVDALWAQMNSADSTVGLGPSQAAQRSEAETTNEDAEMRDQENVTPVAHTPKTDEMIKIKRTYKFAGEMITEEKLVPRDSAEAKLFLSGEQDGEATTATEDDLANASTTVKLRRPLRKISRFDPNPTGSIKKSWEKQPVTEAGQEENARGPKINTVEKSRLDWAAYVDHAGISDELRVHSKAKEGFLGRMDFLDRVDAKREEERRNARLKGV
ncbi:bucentaur or craniofacial development-domain-containing protein [Aspergillus pseudoustus]|uniref:SWR1-complex protein 5 n=1 Tax=Aspergillus pseudoustus TaxID=1810923 RepID=A0ABR4KM48_9EURO